MGVEGWREVSLEEYLAADDFVFWRSRTCGHWRAPGQRTGVFGFAPQEPADLDDTWKTLAGFRWPWRYFADARDFRAASSPARLFGHMLTHGLPVGLRMERVVERGALVVPDDWSMAWWRGAADLPGWAAMRVRVVLTPAEAWAWIEAPELAERVAALTEHCATERGTVVRAEAALRAEPGLDVTALARRLGMSVRSLQRELSRASDSFVALRRRARVALATELLTATDTKIEAVARDVGFRSRAHFSHWFRAQTGATPVEARRQQLSLKGP